MLINNNLDFSCGLASLVILTIQYNKVHVNSGLVGFEQSPFTKVISFKLFLILLHNETRDISFYIVIC